MLIQMGAKRVECKSMEGHTEAHAWLEALGLQREAEHPLYGMNGETFYTYARLEPSNADNETQLKEAA